MANQDYSRTELERAARVLIEQTTRLIALLGVDVTDTEKFPKFPPPLCEVAEAYEQLTFVRKTSGHLKKWEVTKVDGRNGDELMQQVWRVREALWKLDQGGDWEAGEKNS